MRNRMASVVPMVAILMLLPQSARSQTIPSPYRFLSTKQSGNVFAGYLLTGEGSLNLGPKSGPLFGVRYDISLSGPFALEAGASYFSSMRAVYDTVPGDTTRMQVGEADFSTILATGSLRFNLTGPRTWHGMLPYVLFGLGMAVDASSESTDEVDLAANTRFDFGTSFMGLLGGGIDVLLGERFALRLDARNLLWKLDTPDAFLEKGEQARLLPGNEWAQNFSLTAGIAIRF